MKDVTLLHPELQKIITQFLKEAEKQGFIVKVTDTLRTKKEQNELYAQGRTNPGNIVTWVKYPYSNHNWGMAFDICRNDGKGAYNDSDNWFFKVGQIGKSFGLEWGGDWKPQDKPHFQLNKYGSTNYLFQTYKTFEDFKKPWEDLKEEDYMFVERYYKYNDTIKAYTIINENGENYIKLRDLAQLLNKNISYDVNTKITSLDDIIETKNIMVNDKEITVKCIDSNGFNYINAREIGDALGYDVGYNASIQKIFFNIKKSIKEKFKILFK